MPQAISLSSRLASSNIKHAIQVEVAPIQASSAMPPKKSATASSRGPYKQRAKKPVRASVFDDSASETTANSSDLRPRHGSSQTLLGSHNTLKQLLAGSPTEPKSTVVTPPRRPRHSSGTKLSLSPINSASTPISRLKHATAQLDVSNGSARPPIHFDDIESQSPPPKKRRPGRPRKNQPGKKTDPTTTTSSKTTASRRASRSRKPPKIDEFPDDDDSLIDNDPSHIGDTSENKEPTKRRTGRSSYSNRGKRGSSIGNGFVAKPHSEIPEVEYYKHINSDLPAPNRMRQLLAWCFRKTIEEEKAGVEEATNEARTAEGVAKAIEQEILEDIINCKISTSWLSLKEDEVNGENNLGSVPGKTVVRQNPLNDANKESIEIFKEKLSNLRAEKTRLLSAYDSSVQFLEDFKLDSEPASKDELRAYLKKSGREKALQASVLDGRLPDQLQSFLQTVKDVVENDLETNVDKLHAISHRLRQSVSLVSTVEEEKLAPEISWLVSKYVHRDDGKKEPSTKELLRGIAHLDRGRKLN